MLDEFLRPPPEGAAVEVTVETYTGRGMWGETFAPAEPVWAWVDRSTTLVRTLDGEDVMSAAGVFVAPEYGDVLTLGSRVTLPGEDRARTVVTLADRRQGDALGLPLHVEARLS